MKSKLIVSILIVLFAVLIGGQYIAALASYVGAAAVGLIVIGAIFAAELFKEQGSR